MSEPAHTLECVTYAIKTGRPFCIAECADLRRLRTSGVAEKDQEDASQRLTEVEATERGPETEHPMSDETASDQTAPLPPVSHSLTISAQANETLETLAAEQVRTPSQQAAFMLEQILGVRSMTRSDFERMLRARHTAHNHGAVDVGSLLFGKGITDFFASIGKFVEEEGKRPEGRRGTEDNDRPSAPGNPFSRS